MLRPFKHAVVCVAVSVALVVLFGPLASSPLRAGGPPPDYACRSCHAGQTAALPLPSGQTLKLGVDPAALSSSVHGSTLDSPVYCTDCHQDRARYQYPHQPNPAQTRQEFAAGVAQNCRDCHPPIERHNPGHLAAAGNPNLPACTDCHTGGHAMTPAAKLAADRLAFCLACHQTYPNPTVNAVHREVVAGLLPGQTCETCHTGRPVYPADTLCKTCHSLLQGDITLASGDAISLHIEPDAVAGSVHGDHQIQEHRYAPLLCTDCHRQQRLTGFPHDPVTPPDARRFSIEMSSLCRECHPDIFNRQQDSTHAAAVGADPIVYEAHSYPYFFADTNGNGEADADEANYGNRYATWTPRLLQAAYNYQYVAKDPGGFAHNAKYILQILYDSLNDVGDASGMTRPE
ncbi:MAG: hypothetical protein ACE5G8_06510 [Anaerolineae bacterium]